MARTLHRFSTSDYESMAERGLLPTRGVQLLDGLVIAMSPKGERHRYAVRQLAKQFFAQERDRFETDSESLSIVIGANHEPDPDIALSWPRTDGKRPTTEDVFLIVEVARTSLCQDLIDMRRIYAEAGIPEYWVVDLVNDRIEKFWSVDFATYRESAAITTGYIAPLAMPDVRIDVVAVLKRFNADYTETDTRGSAMRSRCRET